jgi:hypothetical protein
MTSIHNVLANGQTISGSAAVPLAEINGELASDVQYDVLVESVAGTPTTAKLQCKIQRWVDIGGGLEYEYGGQWVDMVDGTYQPFSLTATGTSNQAANIRYLNAFSIADFASGATGTATILIRDAGLPAGTSGDVVDQINLPAGGHVQRNWSKPFHFPNGLMIHVTGLGTGIQVRGSAQGSFLDLRGLLPGGDFPGVLADQTLAAPRLVTRKVVGGMRTRIVLTPTFTGGTTPSFKVSATATARY